MKTSLKKLLHKHNNKDRKIQPLAQLDELAKASEAMQDMRDCYDSLLSAAAAATNSAYEFSESLREMGVCLLQKIALNDDEESGKAMLMLGKAQFELQKLVDSYRSHIFQTITVPSESLINELHTVEEMKYQCDEKRELFEEMRTKYREKGRSKSGKGETFTLQQLQAAKEEFDEEATLFVFRLKSLKQGQSRSLLTQAARHHAAQLSFFKKALKSLEAIEPQVKSVTQQQHIDYQFISVEDDESEDVEDDDDDYSDDDVSSTSSMEGVDDSRFDSLHNDREPNFVSAARNNMEQNMKDTHVDSFRRERKMLSQSAPLFSQRKFEPAERRPLQPSSSRKFISYVLPKPGDTRKIPAESENFASQTKLNTVHTENLYHSSPLEPNKYDKLVGTQNLSGPIILNSKSVLKESNKNRTPPPLTERISVQQLKPETTSSSKKPKLQSYSGPLTSKPMTTKPSSGNRVVSTNVPQFSSGPILRTSVHHSSAKISPTASPTFTSPKISELHELPRPPVHIIHGSGKGSVGFSAPLVSRTADNSAVSKVPKIASPLPIPPQIGYFSMPLSGSGAATKSKSSRPLVASPGSEKSEDAFSPPLTPMMLAIQNSL